MMDLTTSEQEYIQKGEAAEALVSIAGYTGASTDTDVTSASAPSASRMNERASLKRQLSSSPKKKHLKPFYGVQLELSNISRREPPEIENFVQRLHNLVDGNGGTIVSFKANGGFDIHNVEKFKELLVLRYELSKPGTSSPINSFQRRLSLYGFKKTLGKNEYKWKHECFTSDGGRLCEISAARKHRRAGPPVDDRCFSQFGIELEQSACSVDFIKGLETRLARVELDLARIISAKSASAQSASAQSNDGNAPIVPLLEAEVVNETLFGAMAPMQKKPKLN